MNQREKFAYLSGLIDASGSICITKTKDDGIYNPTGIRLQVKIKICSYIKTHMDWIVNNFGDYSYEFKNRKEKVARSKKEYYWQPKSENHLKILLNIQEFLIIKKEQCNIAIRFRETVQKDKILIPESIYILRYELYERMKKLNSL